MQHDRKGSRGREQVRILLSYVSVKVADEPAKDEPIVDVVIIRRCWPGVSDDESVLDMLLSPSTSFLPRTITDLLAASSTIGAVADSSRLLEGAA